MGRPSVGKNTSPARVVLAIFMVILGLAFIADLFWFSSCKFSSSYLNIASNPSPRNSVILPNNPQKGESVEVKNNNKDVVAKRILPATFQDLPAPELKWEKMATAPVPRLDGAAIQIKNLLYVFAGYGAIDYVHSHVDIYNFKDNTWGGRFDMPKEMAHSHLGMVTDGRYIYVVTGQYGPQCRGSTACTFVLDTETKKWQDLPLLPVPRYVCSYILLPFENNLYAPATQLWRGRLQVMGGSGENRHTPGTLEPCS